VLIPHGNWIDRYKPTESRPTARQNLELPNDVFIYLFFGYCKPYKNLEGLVEAFRKIAKADDMLLIAGHFSDQAYQAKILDLVAGDRRIRIDHGYISDDCVSNYLVACDALCIPYRQVLTSGSAMLALSYGRPVLSINSGFLRDTIRRECGELIEPGDPEALEEGMLAMRSRSWVEDEILQAARQFTFSEAAEISLSCVGKTGYLDRKLLPIKV
jgi:glycosyltransferase involved in cell wall biosynthesis